MGSNAQPRRIAAPFGGLRRLGDQLNMTIMMVVIEVNGDQHDGFNRVAVPLRRLGDDGDHHEVNGDQGDWFKEYGDANKCDE